MIHCSSMEGFFSPLNSDLLILGVEGSMIFEELDLKLGLTPMVFCACKKFLRFRLGKEEDKEKMRKMGRGR